MKTQKKVSHKTSNADSLLDFVGEGVTEAVIHLCYSKALSPKYLTVVAPKDRRLADAKSHQFQATFITLQWEVYATFISGFVTYFPLWLCPESAQGCHF